jgi:rhodanese-related sulfurtransferase
MSQLFEFIANHPFLFAALFAVIVMLVINEVQSRVYRKLHVSPMDATRLINHEDAVLLDIRDPRELKEGQIAQSIHIPLNNLQSSLQQLDKFKTRPIIAYCRTGGRSMHAVRTLLKHGHTSVYNLSGGLAAWQKASLPIVRG